MSENKNKDAENKPQKDAAPMTEADVINTFRTVGLMLGGLSEPDRQRVLKSLCILFGVDS